MAIGINVCVACTNKTTILPWNIVKADDREYSFRDFYVSCIEQRVPSTQEVTYELVRAELGSSKEKMDLVDLELPVITVVESFG